MSLLSLIFRPELVKLTGLDGSIIISFDAVPVIKHEMSGALTKSQIEDGSQISDNITLENKRATFDIVVSNTPLTNSGYVKDGQVSSPLGAVGALLGSFYKSGRSRIAYEELERIRDNKIPFNAVFKLRIYKNAVITALSATENAQNAGSLNASLTIEEAKMVSTQEVIVAGVNPANLKADVQKLGQPVQDLGKLTTIPATGNNNAYDLKTVNIILGLFGHAPVQ